MPMKRPSEIVFPAILAVLPPGVYQKINTPLPPYTPGGMVGRL